MFNIEDANLLAHNLANGHAIKITYVDKYSKGCKAKGPRNWKPVNLKSVKRAIELNHTTVTLWRG